MNALRTSLAQVSGPLTAMVLLLLLLWVVSTRFLSGAFWQALVALAAVVVLCFFQLVTKLLDAFETYRDF